jgi:hypothetical protein
MPRHRVNGAAKFWAGKSTHYTHSMRRCQNLNDRAFLKLFHPLPDSWYSHPELGRKPKTFWYAKLSGSSDYHENV